MNTTDTAVTTWLILGGGGHAAVVADAIAARGWTLAGCLDDSASVKLKRLGSIGELSLALQTLPEGSGGHAAAGDSALRRRWLAMLEEHGVAMPAVIHPSAVVSPSATIAEGVFIGPGAIVNAFAVVGRGAIVNSGAIVEHDCHVGEFAHVGPGAVLAGMVHVGESSLIGAGAAVRPGLRVGRSAVIGLGAAVVDHVPDGVTAIGVPARWVEHEEFAGI